MEVSWRSADMSLRRLLTPTFSSTGTPTTPASPTSRLDTRRRRKSNEQVLRRARTIALPNSRLSFSPSSRPLGHRLYLSTVLTLFVSQSQSFSVESWTERAWSGRSPTEGVHPLRTRLLHTAPLEPTSSTTTSKLSMPYLAAAASALSLRAWPQGA